jgi:hypothetical protein
MNTDAAQCFPIDVVQDVPVALLTQPEGPYAMTIESRPAVTWRRRAALALGMAALAAAFAVACGSHGSGHENTTTTTTTTPTTTATTAANDSGGSSGGGGGGGGGHHHEGGQQQAPVTDTVTQTDTATATATQTETQTQTSTQTVPQRPGWQDQRPNEHNQYGGQNQYAGPNQNGGPNQQQPGGH